MAYETHGLSTVWYNTILKKMNRITIFILSTYLLLFSILTLKCQDKMESQDFRIITYKEFNEEAIKLIGHDWMLIAAGNSKDFNMMTAAWGGLGWLWNKPVAYIFVRPQRHTFNYTEREDYFTLTFFEEQQREILREMGTKSGRDFDKMNYDKLTPFVTEFGSIAFKEARLIIECRKLFSTTLKPEDFVDKSIEKQIYPAKDFHIMYIGEIVNILTK